MLKVLGGFATLVAVFTSQVGGQKYLQLAYRWRALSLASFDQDMREA